MDWIIVAQILGVLGMGMNVLSFQGKKQKTIIGIQLFGSLFFAVHFFLLGAYTGALLNGAAIIRAALYANKEKIRHISVVNGIFIGFYLLSYVLTFTVFQKAVTPFHLAVELLPVIAMIATTISFAMPSAASVRKFALIGSPSWLVYNCINFSIGGILCESFSLVSVVLAMVRLDRKQ